jgi:hypothetical protein
MDAALKVLRIIQAALICSVVLYMIIGEVAGRHPTINNPTIAIAMAAIATVLLSLWWCLGA